MEADTAGNPVVMPGETFTRPDLPLPADGFSMTDHERAWRESVDAKLDRILELLQPAVVKPKVERPAEWFADFWKVYPKKVGKKQCLEVWKRGSLDGLAADIINDVRRRIKNCPKWQGGYIVDPVRYLRGERWNDEIQKASSVPVNVPKELNALVRYAAKSGLEPKVGESTNDFYIRVCNSTRLTRGEGE